MSSGPNQPQDDGRSSGSTNPGDGDALGRHVTDRIGPYELRATLGEGGMGVVYLAEQHTPVQRQVALKVIKPGMDTRQVVARFEAERQALAVMDHPNIAKVFDGGATETGLPYFVMELVRGVPITEYCDEHELSIRERLELFMPVCQAVQHAHQKGVVHRDLKPSNVLITEQDERPVAKVIDFGVAKAIDQRLSEHTIQTQTGHLIGTPAYMSPEQAEGSGLDVDTRTDIYSLGMILYQMLTGELPFTEKELQGITALYTLLEKDPPTPASRYASLDGAQRAAIARLRSSDAVTLGRKLKGDINWIVMKAIEKDRGRRYETVNALLLELGRYLNDEPVLARAPSTTYRVTKFVRRHRAAVAAATALAVAIVASSVVISYLAVEATRARDRAEVRRGQAEDLISFMVGDLRGKLEPVGRLEILDDVAKKAQEYFAAVPEAELTEEELFRRSQALSQLGQVRIAQGNLPAALEVFRQALDLSQGLSARDPQKAEWQVGLGAAYFWVGYVDWLRDDLDAALEPMRTYLKISQDLVSRDSQNPEWQLEVGYAYSNIGSIQEARGDLQAALEAYRGTLEIKRLLAEKDPENLDRQFDLANGHNKVALALQKSGDLEGALKHFRAEAAIRQTLVERDSSDARWLEFLSINHNYMGGLLEDMGDLQGAQREYEADMSITRALVARDTTNAGWERGLGLTEKALGRVLAQLGQRTRGMELLHASRSRFERLVALDPSNDTWQRLLAASETAIGTAELLSGQPASARVRGERAIEVLTSLTEAEDESRRAKLTLADARFLVGRANAALGRSVQARQNWVRALELVEPLARESREIAYQAMWASTLMELDRTDDARPLVDSLTAHGYRRVDFVALARAKGLLH